AASEWMLPVDYALLLTPDPARPRWIARPACLIIRVRGVDATIVGGNLFDALPARTSGPNAGSSAAEQDADPSAAEQDADPSVAGRDAGSPAARAADNSDAAPHTAEDPPDAP